MRILVLMASLAATALTAGTAEANCRWQANTRLVGVQPGVGNFPDQSWPLANLQTRLQVRTPGGWWNTANWPATTTDADGFASITSAIAFADPDCQTAREFRVQVRSFDTGMQWRTVHTESKPGHSDHLGLFAPAPVHQVELGFLVLDGEYRGNGVIFVEDIGEPPVTWSSAGDEDTGPVIEAADPPASDDGPDTGGDQSPPDLTGASFEEDPCHVYRVPVDLGIEFRFGQMPASPGPLSPDQHLRVETRPNGGGAMTLNRLANHFRVENAGSRDYRALYHCPVEVHLRLNEGPGERSGDGWSTPYTLRIPDLAANGVVDLEMDSNLLGAGDDLEGAWDQAYEYVLIELTLDATNRIAETAEGDNRITHCYHAPTNSFAAPAQCEG